MNVFISLITVTGLLAVLGTFLVAAHRWLTVAEDPRINAVEAMLPNTNCGGCGFPGCRAFAEALVNQQTLPGKCGVATAVAHAQIAQFLGVEVGTFQKQVARLACAGGDNVAHHRAHYQGLQSCAAASLVAGGGKSCFWGCLGLADCELACTFDAIQMDSHRLPVVDEDRCTACGDCVVACPKDLFSLEGIENRLWVACRSQEEGDAVLDHCVVGCTACGRCEMDAPDQVQMRGSLPIVNYSHGHLTEKATQRCPTGAIVWISPTGPLKGRTAGPIVRHQPLPDKST